MPSTPTAKPNGGRSRRDRRRDTLESRRVGDDDLRVRIATLEAGIVIERRNFNRLYAELADELATTKRHAEADLENAARKLQLERDNTRHLLKSQSLRHAIGLRERDALFAETLNDVQKQHHELLQKTKQTAEARFENALAIAAGYEAERFAAFDEITQLKARLARAEPPLVFPCDQ